MGELSTYTFESRAVRVVTRDGEPWWVAKDVCDALGIGKYRDAIARLDADEGCPVKVDTLGGPQEMAAVSEPGLYTLIMRSHKPEARRFRRWVTHEVLPVIRRTGQYRLDDNQELRASIWSALRPLLQEVRAVAADIGASEEDTRLMQLRVIEEETGIAIRHALTAPRSKPQTPIAAAREKICLIVHDAGKIGVLKSELTRQTQTLNRHQRNEILEDLIKAGQIRSVEKDGKTVFVSEVGCPA